MDYAAKIVGGLLMAVACSLLIMAAKAGKLPYLQDKEDYYSVYRFEADTSSQTSEQ